MRTLYPSLLAIAVAGACQTAVAATAIPMNLVNANGTVTAAGTIQAEATPHGVMFTPDLKGLPVGVHGFHVHENPSCEYRMTDGKLVPAAAAGGHYDPAKTGKHLGPWGDGHLGDLPALYVDANGNATYPVVAPRLKLGDLKGRALMIHMGSDNHADHPAPLGGGGVRMACGVVP